MSEFDALSVRRRFVLSTSRLWPHRFLDLNLGSRHQTQLPVGHDPFSGPESLIDDRLSLRSAVHGYRPGFHGHVRLDYEHVLTLHAVMEGLRSYAAGITYG